MASNAICIRTLHLFIPARSDAFSITRLVRAISNKLSYGKQISNLCFFLLIYNGLLFKMLFHHKDRKTQTKHIHTDKFVNIF